MRIKHEVFMPLIRREGEAQADFGYAMAGVYTNIKQYFFIFNQNKYVILFSDLAGLAELYLRQYIHTPQCQLFHLGQQCFPKHLLLPSRRSQ